MGASDAGATPDSSGAGAGGAAGAGGLSFGGTGGSCPAVQPVEGKACDSPWNQHCDYPSACDAGGSCSAQCIAGKWFVDCPACGAAPACPKSAPTNGSACAQGPRYTCVIKPCNVDDNFVAATCDHGVWSIDSRICVGVECMGGEDIPPCPAGDVCVHGPSCDFAMQPVCQPNPCTSAPLSCACAKSLCGNYVCGTTGKGYVNCQPPLDPSAPTVLAEHLYLEGPLVLAGGTLYAASQPVLAVDPASGVTQPFGPPGNSGLDVVADANKVYWIQVKQSGQPPIEIVSEAVGGGSPTTLVSGAQAQHLALDGSYVYFTTSDSDPAHPHSVERVPTSGGTVEVLGSGVSLYGLAVAPGGVYFADRNNATNLGLIYYAPFGGKQVSVATQQGFPSLLAIDSVRVYWLDEWPPDVKALSQSGGAPQALYSAKSGTSTPKGIWLEAGNVYFTDHDTGDVREVAASGGPATLVSKGPYGASGIVTDASHVYWATESLGCGRVLKASK